MNSDNYSAAVGRPREFDIDEAVEAAMQVFWSRGYNGTSLPDLIDGTGLSRGSLYKAFGDKRALFLLALDRYTSAAAHRLSATLRESGHAKVVIRKALSRYAQLSIGMAGQRGCLLLATATEMVPHDEEIAQRASRMFAAIQHAFADAIQRGKDAGEITQKVDSATLAQLLLCLVQGMRAVGKTGLTKAEVTAVIDCAMQLLD
ncbi:TetR family transcriptional regulator [Burkholderia sp. Leaf177]|uniref:TetR/AcrR family transcriptional regulator n=1 Tax=Burkholderia sp. Leaf177 TaxID=1736287 RepID=UPI0006F85978|nr:TetR/AcrR family transcriptional regulator [Burkholderia sp. Leaf177]KQR81519.1 TetR family transcriptional regulator [Burkholderia sp. Leaf177]